MDTYGVAMNCYVCGNELIWGGDHSGADYCMDDEDAIVTNLSCPHCGAYHEVTWNQTEED